MKLKILAVSLLSLSALNIAPAVAQEAAPVTMKASGTIQAENKVNSFEALMIDKVWVTTEAIDQDKKQINPSDAHVVNFFGLAEYFPDGTFKMQTLDGKPKMQGDWEFSEDGKTRTLKAKNDKGEILFTRTVENITVTPDEYTYRIYPDESKKSQYADIVHKVKK